MSEKPIGWDIESHLIKPGLTAPRMVCLSAVEPDGTKHLYDREQGLDFFEERILPQPNVAHHAFFDFGVVAAERPRLIPAIFEAFERGDTYCTKIRQMMIDNARGELKFIWDEDKLEFKRQNYALWRLIQRHKGYDVQKKKEGGGDIWRLRYSELDGVPVEEYPEDARIYAIDDSIEGQDIWTSQEEVDLEGSEIPGFVSQMQAAWALNLLGTWGLRTDATMIRKLKGDLEVEFAEQVNICREHGFRRGQVRMTEEAALKAIQSEESKKARARDMKAIRAAIEKWYGERDLELKITPKGQIATDREQLTTTDHPGLNAVAESVKTEKLLSTYIPALERGTVVPLNPNYNPIIETFRTSCSGGMKIDGIPVGMNVQNLPRKGNVRECVIPRPGNRFAFCDYDTLEMRTLAQVCLWWFGYSALAESIRADRDQHLDLAADMLGISYGEAVARYEAGDEEIENARQYCKIGNYGLAGGMGPDTFILYAKGMGITVTPEKAIELHLGFRRKWHEMVAYFNHCGFLAGGGNAEKIIFPGSGMVRGDVRYTAICNGFFQHLAAMGAKDALYHVVKECYCDPGSPLFGCRPWLFAHDEIGMEIPYEAIGPKGAHEAAMRLQQIMIDRMQVHVPDVPIGATVAMTPRWYKGAKPVNDNGLLVPCKPEGKKWVIAA